jgi:hypothetical protein
MARMSPAELYAMDQEWQSAALCLGDAPAEENVLLLPTGESGHDPIGPAVDGVSFPEPVDADLVWQSISGRGQLTGTATEGGPFPHTARWGDRAHDLLGNGRLLAGVDSAAVDGGWPDPILLLLTRDTRRHLFLPTTAARLCRQPRFLKRIRRATCGREVVRVVRNAERHLFTSPVSSLS